MAKKQESKSVPPVAKKPGRVPMTEAQKAAKKAELKAEGKDARFLRLIKPRMGKALKCIKLLGNLSGQGYVYTPEQIAKMRVALDSAIAETFARFVPKIPGAKSQDAGFDFDAVTLPASEDAVALPASESK